MKKILMLTAALAAAFLSGCNNDDSDNPESIIELKNRSITPTMLKKMPGFEDLQITSLISSEDQIAESPNFVYGSMADGAGLLKNNDGTYTFINNIEADYSISRITLDGTFKPIKGEYIVNSDATANTAQCSGSLITPEEHGFGPLYLSGGEWGGSSRNVFVVDPYRNVSDAGFANTLANFGSWTIENAVVLGKDAFPGQTIAMIGDDSHGDAGGQLAMYYSTNAADLNNGKLYALKLGDGSMVDNDLEVGKSYSVSFVEMNERTYDELNAESMEKGVMAFNRVEDIDWRRGSAENQREIYFNATGRNKYNDTRTKYGRVYKLTLEEGNPLAGNLELILNGDDLNGPAAAFHSPDNILVTENYAYIQEDPNGYDDEVTKQHDARVYQYNLNTGEVKPVLEVDRTAYIDGGYGSADDRWGKWELTGMIDISETIGIANTFMLVVQAHSWKNDAFLNPDGAGSADNSSSEGSYTVIIQGLSR